MSEDTTANIQQIQAGVAWSEIELKQKLVDPAINNKKELNRNLQLGYIDLKLYTELSRRNNRAMIFLSYGSGIAYNYGLSVLQNIEQQLVMSGSIGGKVRDSLNTTTQNQKYTEERSGMFGGMFRKRRE